MYWQQVPAPLGPIHPPRWQSTHDMPASGVAGPFDLMASSQNVQFGQGTSNGWNSSIGNSFSPSTLMSQSFSQPTPFAMGASESRRPSPSKKNSAVLMEHMKILQMRTEDNVTFQPVIDPLDGGTTHLMCGLCNSRRLYKRMGDLRCHQRRCQAGKDSSSSSCPLPCKNLASQSHASDERIGNCAQPREITMLADCLSSPELLQVLKIRKREIYNQLCALYGTSTKSEEATDFAIVKQVDRAMFVRWLESVEVTKEAEEEDFCRHSDPKGFESSTVDAYFTEEEKWAEQTVVKSSPNLELPFPKSTHRVTAHSTHNIKDQFANKKASPQGDSRQEVESQSQEVRPFVVLAQKHSKKRLWPIHSKLINTRIQSLQNDSSPQSKNYQEKIPARQFSLKQDTISRKTALLSPPTRTPDRLRQPSLPKRSASPSYDVFPHSCAHKEKLHRVCEEKNTPYSSPNLTLLRSPCHRNLSALRSASPSVRPTVRESYEKASNFNKIICESENLLHQNIKRLRSRRARTSTQETRIVQEIDDRPERKLLNQTQPPTKSRFKARAQLTRKLSAECCMKEIGIQCETVIMYEKGIDAVTAKEDVCGHYICARECNNTPMSILDRNDSQDQMNRIRSLQKVAVTLWPIVFSLKDATRGVLTSVGVQFFERRDKDRCKRCGWRLPMKDETHWAVDKICLECCRPVSMMLQQANLKPTHGLGSQLIKLCARWEKWPGTIGWETGSRWPVILLWPLQLIDLRSKDLWVATFPSEISHCVIPVRRVQHWTAGLSYWNSMSSQSRKSDPSRLLSVTETYAIMTKAIHGDEALQKLHSCLYCETGLQTTLLETLRDDLTEA